ncbi:MAG TPA: hypothetical protein VK487_06355 [Candidatus Bathyarchaeia archaeon]|nr:hypothetical protein [Candidatus Bathyarchaeia archaeon]
MRFKVHSVESLHSVDHIDRLVDIVNRYLRVLYGTLGSQEFSIDRFDFDDNAELWDIKLIRTVHGRKLNYEMSIDNDSGELYSFGRRRR